MTDAEIQAEAHRLANTVLHTSQAETEIAIALMKASERPMCETCKHFTKHFLPSFDGTQFGDCAELKQQFASEFGCNYHRPKESEIE
jgi:hypothetical protein